MIRLLLVLAGMTWVSGAVALLTKGALALLQANAMDGQRNWPWLMLAVGVVVGVAKARFLFFGICRRNISRIAALDRPSWWQFYRPRFFAFLALMSILGLTVSHWAKGSYAGLCAIAVIDLSVGTALLISSAAYLQARVLIADSPA